MGPGEGQISGARGGEPYKRRFMVSPSLKG